LNRSEADLLNERIVAARNALNKGQLLKVQGILGPELERGVKHADVYYLLGEVQRLRKRSGEALELLLQCIGMRVHTPYALYSLGLIYAESDRHDKAVALLRTFLSQVETAAAHYELANCLIKCGENKEAIVHLTRSIELNRPDERSNLVAYILRADLYESIGYQECAQQDYRRVLKVEPTYHLSYLEHAEELEAEGQLKEALAVRTFISKLFA
jgi:tetratricopeptide (TPR) repeat protein